MAKKGRYTYPTDSEAAAGAQTARHPMNIEEAQHAPQPPEEEPVAYCEKCKPLPALHDPRGTHKCARCRSEMTDEFRRKRDRERAEARAKEAEKVKDARLR